MLLPRALALSPSLTCCVVHAPHARELPKLASSVVVASSSLSPFLVTPQPHHIRALDPCTLLRSGAHTVPRSPSPVPTSPRYLSLGRSHHRCSPASPLLFPLLSSSGRKEFAISPNSDHRLHQCFLATRVSLCPHFLALCDHLDFIFRTLVSSVRVSSQRRRNIIVVLRVSRNTLHHRCLVR